MMMKTWAVLAFVLSVCLCVESNHRQILENLAKDFSCLPSNNQFAVMYMAPPNDITYNDNYKHEDFEQQCSSGYVTFPRLTDEMLVSGKYPFLYAATTPDYKGEMYSHVLNRSSVRGNTINAEELCLDLLFPLMSRWYNETFYPQGPKILYLYTYYSPSPDSYSTIRSFLNNNEHINLFLGYSELTRRQISNELGDLLANQSGRLFRNIGGGYDYAAEMYLTMDFSVGKAKVRFRGLSSNYYGWFGLYNEYGSRVTWEWSYSASDGAIDFRKKLKPGMYAKYFIHTDSYVSTIRTSKWSNTCNFPKTYVNALRENTLPTINQQENELYIQLNIDDSRFLNVCLFRENISDWIHNVKDFVAIQSISDFSSGLYEDWEWVRNFREETSNSKCARFAELTSERNLWNGFRAKYVYYDGDYQYEGLYDNASPFWTSDECPGARGVRV